MVLFAAIRDGPLDALSYYRCGAWLLHSRMLHPADESLPRANTRKNPLTKSLHLMTMSTTMPRIDGSRSVCHIHEA